MGDSVDLKRLRHIKMKTVFALLALPAWLPSPLPTQLREPAAASLSCSSARMRSTRQWRTAPLELYRRHPEVHQRHPRRHRLPEVHLRCHPWTLLKTLRIDILTLLLQKIIGTADSFNLFWDTFCTIFLQFLCPGKKIFFQFAEKKKKKKKK